MQERRNRVYEFAWGMIDWALAACLLVALGPFLAQYSAPIQINALLSLLLIAAGLSRIVVDAVRPASARKSKAPALWRFFWGAELLTLTFILSAVLKEMVGSRYALFLVGFYLQAHGLFIVWHRDRAWRSHGLQMLCVGMACILLSILFV